LKKIAILQPNYIPWKGVFDLISRVDVFVFLDDVQFTAKDWRSRNRIRTAHGDIWLTVPVLTRGLRDQLICDAVIDPLSNWQTKHYKALEANYRKARHFKDYAYLLEEIYLANKWTKIADLNVFATKLIAEALGISAEWHRSSDLRQAGGKNGERAINLCKVLGCDYFINGPTARAFMDASLFRENGIKLDYMSYDYPEYEQLHQPFVHEVTVLDLIFNAGPNARALACVRRGD
jgi:hypothetical protein